MQTGRPSHSIAFTPPTGQRRISSDAYPDWEAKFWWVHRVGFVRMLYSATDGRQLDFELEEIRSVD